jgi:hypothetical protein
MPLHQMNILVQGMNCWRLDLQIIKLYENNGFLFCYCWHKIYNLCVCFLRKCYWYTCRILQIKDKGCSCQLRDWTNLMRESKKVDGSWWKLKRSVWASSKIFISNVKLSYVLLIRCVYICFCVRKKRNLL